MCIYVHPHMGRLEGLKMHGNALIQDESQNLVAKYVITLVDPTSLVTGYDKP